MDQHVPQVVFEDINGVWNDTRMGKGFAQLKKTIPHHETEHMIPIQENQQRKKPNNNNNKTAAENNPPPPRGRVPEGTEQQQPGP